eukprot:CAMPEP_0194277086 /NCGR_PEP_ID=MMETSP0169-20130528/9502_1 /TAXON_ID=218684 /ORGANISM="Corethron pennatum, Strain L29A3" /LENGTH=319 /DNA_ID=CAMNT_0039020957 /DNA_START=33 /DNA_END=992 /DNA_ORIENTATION=-
MRFGMLRSVIFLPFNFFAIKLRGGSLSHPDSSNVSNLIVTNATSSAPTENEEEKIRVVISTLRAGMAAARNRDLPFVTLAYASTLDGMIAVRGSSNLPISGPASLVLTHALRAEHDAVLVGTATALLDRPRLTVRRKGMLAAHSDQPAAVVIDARLRILDEVGRGRLPPAATAREGGGGGTHRFVVCCAAGSLEERSSTPVPDHWTILPCDTDDAGRIDLEDALRRLRGLGICSVMVEGGGETLGGFLRAGGGAGGTAVDCICVTVALKILRGGKGVPAFGTGEKILAEGGVDAGEAFMHLCDTNVLCLGSDIIVLGMM